MTQNTKTVTVDQVEIGDRIKLADGWLHVDGQAVYPSSTKPGYTVLETEIGSMIMADEIEVEITKDDPVTAGEPFVIVDGGRVANTPTLPVFDMDILEGIEWPRDRAQVLELREEMKPFQDLPEIKQWWDFVTNVIEANEPGA